MLVVVAYDVADERRRMRLHTLLLGFGNPVQESVFECELDAVSFRQMQRLVRRFIRPRDDRVRFYPLCANCAGRIEDESGKRIDPPSPAIVV